MSLSAGNKVVFLKSMARLHNSVGEVSNNIAQQTLTIKVNQIKTLRADLDIDILQFKSRT